MENKIVEHPECAHCGHEKQPQYEWKVSGGRDEWVSYNISFNYHISSGPLMTILNIRPLGTVVSLAYPNGNIYSYRRNY